VSPSCAGEAESRRSRATRPPRTPVFTGGARALDRLEPPTWTEVHHLEVADPSARIADSCNRGRPRARPGAHP
jgi:hypothetical protein